MIKEQNKNSSSESINIEQKDEGDRTYGKWTEEENIKYGVFLNLNKRKFESIKKRRQLRMFDRLAEYLGQRTSLQVRSHHQKLLLKFKNIKGIVCRIKAQFGKKKFKQLSTQLKKVNKQCKTELIQKKPQVQVKQENYQENHNIISLPKEYECNMIPYYHYGNPQIMVPYQIGFPMPYQPFYNFYGQQ